MLGRTRVLGFEQGAFYENTPSTADITIDATSARSGGYGLHVKPLSGVKTTLVVSTNQPGTFGAMFGRAWIKVVSLPGTARSILCFNGITPGTTVPDLLLNPTGTLSLRGNGTINATSTLTISTGVWTMLEWTLSSTDKQISVRLGGVEAIAYTTPSGTGSTSMATVGVGACDTVAAAFEYYLDDISFDSQAWCDDGQVISRKVTGILNDNANFTVVGAATKWQAVSELPPDDDTSYVLTGTTTAQNLDLTVEGFPGSATLVNGSTLYVRHKRNATSNGSIIPRPLFGAFDQGTGAGALTPGSAYATSALNWAESPLGPFQTAEIWNGYSVRIQNNSTNSSRISALWFEVDYLTTANPFTDSAMLLATSFEDGKNDIAGAGAQTSGGTIDYLSTHALTGTNALRLTHASGGRSFLGSVVTSSSWVNKREVNIAFWLYLESLPSSGTMGLFHATSGSADYEVLVGSDGSIQTSARAVAGSASNAAAGTLAVGTWHLMSIKMRLASATTVATEGFIQVYLDDALVASRTACNAGITSFAAESLVLGSSANVTGGAVVWYDDYIVDYAVLHTRATRLAVLVPSGTGTDTNANYTAVGAATKWQALGQLPNDGDTSYVLVPTTGNVAESWALGDLAAKAIHVWGLCHTSVAKQDTTSSTFQVGILEGGETAITQLAISGFATGAAYASLRVPWPYSAPSLGAWTPALVNSLEVFALTTAIPGGKEHLTSASVTVAYTVPTWSQVSQVVAEGVVQGTARQRTSQLVAEGVVQGAARQRTSQVVAEIVLTPLTVITRTKEVTGDAWLISVNTKEVVGSGLVQTANTKEATATAIVFATQTTEATATAIVKGTDTLEVTSTGALQDTKTTEVAATGAVQTANSVSADADGVILAASIREIASDGVITVADNTLEVSGSALVQIQDQTRSADADAIMRVTDTREVDGDGFINGSTLQERAVAGDALVQITNHEEVLATAILQTTTLTEATATAVLQQTNTVEITATAILQTTQLLEVAGSGEVFATQVYETAADAIVQATQALEVAGTGAIQTTNSVEADATAMVEQTDRLEVSGDAYLLFIWQLEISGDGVIAEFGAGVNVDGDAYCAGIDGVLQAKIFANRRINAIPFVLGDTAGGYLNIVYPHPQDRTGAASATKRIALMDLSLDGVLHESLAGGDLVRYTLYHEDGSQYQPSTDAAWDIVYVDEIGEAIYGWTDLIALPAQSVKIVWSVLIAGLKETIVDLIEVTP